MINLESFFDELSNIKTAAQKCRSGSPPIRAGNLAKKSRYDGTGKRTTKLATPRLIMDLVGKGGKMSTEAKKNLALLGGGTATGVLGKGEFDKYRLGRRVYEAQNQ